MSRDIIHLGDIEIPIKVVHEPIDDLHGANVKLYETNKLYVEDGVSLNNSGVLKVNYDSVDDTFDFGWIRSISAKYDENGNAVVDDKGNHIVEEKFLHGKISRWSEEDEKLKSDFTHHINDENRHINFSTKDTLSFLQDIASLVKIGYGNESKTVFVPPLNNYGEITSFKNFFINPINGFDFTTVKIKMPQINQNLEKEVYLRVDRLENSYDKSGEILGISLNSVKIYSTDTSEGSFEWNFTSSIKIKDDDLILFSFHHSENEEDTEDVYITSETNYIDLPHSYMDVKEIENDEPIYLRLFNIPNISLESKIPNHIYFK